MSQLSSVGFIAIVDTWRETIILRSPQQFYNDQSISSRSRRTFLFFSPLHGLKVFFLAKNMYM